MCSLLLYRSIVESCLKFAAKFFETDDNYSKPMNSDEIHRKNCSVLIKISTVFLFNYKHHYRSKISASPLSISFTKLTLISIENLDKALKIKITKRSLGSKGWSKQSYIGKPKQ